MEKVVCFFSSKNTRIITGDVTERLVEVQHQYSPNFFYMKSSTDVERGFKGCQAAVFSHLNYSLKKKNKPKKVKILHVRSLPELPNLSSSQGSNSLEGNLALHFPAQKG